MSPASPTLAARAGRAHSRSLEPGSRVADPRGSSIPTSVDSIPTSVDSIPTSVDSTPTTVDSTPTTVDSTPTTVDSSQTSGESTHPHASRFGRLHGSFEASSHVASTSTKHRHEREHRLHEHRRKRRRARIQCDVVVGWKSAACVSLQPLVAASRLALPVAYVGISKRMRGRYAGLPELWTHSRGAELSRCSPFGTFMRDRLHGAPRGGARGASNRRSSIRSTRSMAADCGAPRGGALVQHTGCAFHRSWSSNAPLRRRLHSVAEGCDIVARTCAQGSMQTLATKTVVVAAPRCGTPTTRVQRSRPGPSNEGLQQTRWALRSAQVPIAGC